MGKTVSFTLGLSIVCSFQIDTTHCRSHLQQQLCHWFNSIHQSSMATATEVFFRRVDFIRRDCIGHCILFRANVLNRREKETEREREKGRNDAPMARKPTDEQWWGKQTDEQWWGKQPDEQWWGKQPDEQWHCLYSVIMKCWSVQEDAFLSLLTSLLVRLALALDEEEAAEESVLQLPIALMPLLLLSLVDGNWLNQMNPVNKNHLLLQSTALHPLADQGFHLPVLLLTIVAETVTTHVHLILPLLLIAVATLPLLLLIPLIPIMTVKGILSNSNSSNDTHKEDQ